MPERRRPVLLEEEMADPGEAVAAEQRAEQIPAVAAPDRQAEQYQNAEAADEMQAARRAVGVFAQVERVELAEAGEAGHGCSCVGSLADAARRSHVPGVLRLHGATLGQKKFSRCKARYRCGIDTAHPSASTARNRLPRRTEAEPDR